MLIHNIKINRYLRKKDAVSLRAHAAAQGGVPHVSAENFHHNNPVVAHPCCFYVPREKSNPVYRRVSSDTIGLKVKVHGLRHMNAQDAVRGKVNNNASGIVAATYNQGVYLEFLSPALILS